MDSDRRDSDMICAAILAGAYVCAQRQTMTSAVLEHSIREKFPEYLQFVRELGAKAASAPKTEGKE